MYKAVAAIFLVAGALPAWAQMTPEGLWRNIDDKTGEAKAEIRRLGERIDRERVSVVPLSMYFRDGRVKVELGIGKGRTKGDKRQAIAERDAQRDIEREMGRRNKYSG